VGVILRESPKQSRSRQRERRADTHILEEDDPKDVKDGNNDDKTRTTSRGSIWRDLIQRRRACVKSKTLWHTAFNHLNKYLNLFTLKKIKTPHLGARPGGIRERWKWSVKTFYEVKEWTHKPLVKHSFFQLWRV